MRQGGYSPKGYRPEPTEASPTPAPTSPPAESATPKEREAAQDARSRLYWFIHVRFRKNGASQGEWEQLGYLNGRAEAAIEYGDLSGARGQLERMRAMAGRWSDRPDFPAAEGGR